MQWNKKKNINVKSGSKDIKGCEKTSNGLTKFVKQNLYKSSSKIASDGQVKQIGDISRVTIGGDLISATKIRYLD